MAAAPWTKHEFPELQTYSLWSPALAKERKLVIGTTLKAFVAIILLIWIILPVFYGSTYLLEAKFSELVIDVYDFDSVASGTNALLGPKVVAGVLASMKQPVHFTFNVVDMSTGPVPYVQIADGIVNNAAWGAVIINSNATTMFTQALSGTGGLIEGAYAPQGAISLVVSSARFYQVILDYLLPYLDPVVAVPVAEASLTVVANALAGLNPTQFAALSTTQLQAISMPFATQIIDLRPIPTRGWSGSAPLEAGLIYFVILSFSVCILLKIARLPFLFAEKRDLRLSYRSVLALRFVPVLVIYFFLSLFYSLLNLAFQVPMDGGGHGYTPGAGFMVFWVLNFFTITALGFAIESMSTILPPPFLPFFLLTWIVLNITSSFFPPILMQEAYLYGVGMPFYSSTRADKTIFFGAKNGLGQDFGILISWTVLSVITLSLFEWLNRRKANKAALISQTQSEDVQEKKSPELLPVESGEHTQQTSTSEEGDDDSAKRTTYKDLQTVCT